MSDLKNVKKAIEEINRQLADIENAYPYPPDCDKWTRMRYDDLYSDYKMYLKQLEEIEVYDERL